MTVDHAGPQHRHAGGDEYGGPTARAQPARTPEDRREWYVAQVRSVTSCLSRRSLSGRSIDAVREPRVEHRQRSYDVRCEWGAHGVALLARECAVVVIVDVLSFCTSVDVAVGRGAGVLPLRWNVPAVRSATAEAMVWAGRRDGRGPSLRPSSLLDLAPGTVLALPSPNGASLCVAAACHGATVLAGCLRNATAVANAAAMGGPIGIVPAGERWPDDTLRVAAEDALGAGAIIAALDGGRTLSPEAELVAAQFAAAEHRLPAVLAALASGRELVADGYGADLDLAAAHDVSAAAPRLVDGLLTG